MSLLFLFYFLAQAVIGGTGSIGGTGGVTAGYSQLYVSDGDSITNIGSPSYGQVGVNGLSANITQYYNTGQGGLSSPQLSQHYPALLARFSSVLHPAYASLMIGANDCTGGIYSTPSGTYGNELAWVTQVKAYGYSAFVLTNTSLGGQCTGNSVAYSGDQYMQALAVLIRNGATANGYTVIDVNANSLMGCTGCSANTTYFFDGSEHPSQAGLNIIGGLVTTALTAAGYR